MDSILLSVKKLLGIHQEDNSFDVDITICINTVLSTLRQLGFGPTEGFIVKDETALWSSIIDVRTDAELVKSYVHLKTKLLFDPPTNSAAMEATNKMISELEWRIVNL